MTKKRVARKKNSTYGTSYFTSRGAANRYYKDYGDDAEDVARKIREGSIHIGKPPLKPGERLSTTDGGKRYMITTANPSKVLPRGKWISAKIRVTKNGTIQARIPATAARNPSKGLYKIVFDRWTGGDHTGYNAWDYLRSEPRSVAFEHKKDAQYWLSQNQLGPDDDGVEARFKVVAVP